MIFEVAEQLKAGGENEKERNAFDNAKQIVQEVAEEYKGDMKHNLAEMYAKNMVDYGVDVTKAWQTAIQQSYALEKAYISGRQYEVDRFNELRKEYSNGWIPCSERLPEEPEEGLTDLDECDEYIAMIENADIPTALNYAGNGEWYCDGEFYKVIAWQPLPEPYKEND